MPPTESIPEVDVEEMLNSKEKTAGQLLNWRSSIVDLLKSLDLDSSLQTRKDLAAELGYSGDTNDSATMNIWLHRQVMNKLAANGGKVPADLKDLVSTDLSRSAYWKRGPRAPFLFNITYC